MALLDIKTLMACNAVVVVFVAIALIVYWSDQKTYFGFGMWIAASICIALGYAFLIPRGVIPVWVSILVNNALFVLGVLCRLDGIMRFTNNKKLPTAYYAVPVLVMALSAYYYFVDDRIAMRTLLMGGAFFLICSAAFRQLTKYSPRNHKRLYWSAAMLSITFGVITLLRGILWFVDPHRDIFLAGGYQSFYYLLIIIYEAGMGTLFIMMNSQRTEDRLIDSQNKLQTTVADLETALSEIKTLSGLLPICASCKKIRDDKGYWNQIETYISSHSAAEFSHSICPDCIKKLYPELADSILDDLNDRKK